VFRLDDNPADEGYGLLPDVPGVRALEVEVPGELLGKLAGYWRSVLRSWRFLLGGRPSFERLFGRQRRIR